MSFLQMKASVQKHLQVFVIIYLLMNVMIKISVETVHWYIPDANYSTEDSTRGKVPLLCSIMLLQGQALNSGEVAKAPPIQLGLKSILLRLLCTLNNTASALAAAANRF